MCCRIFRLEVIQNGYPKPKKRTSLRKLEGLSLPMAYTFNDSVSHHDDLIALENCLSNFVV